MMNRMSFQVISSIFCDFQLERDRPTDRSSYRGAMAHLKTHTMGKTVGDKFGEGGKVMRVVSWRVGRESDGKMGKGVRGEGHRWRGVGKRGQG